MFRKIPLFLLLLSLLFSTFAASAQEPRFVINSGHNQPVHFLEYDSARESLFSGSDDGTLRIWDPDTGNLRYIQNLSRSPLRLTALNPVRPEAAIISSDTLNSFVLTCWNWETGEKIFSRRLAELPLFMKYSPGGSYLVYGVANWNSLGFIDSKSGAVLPYLTDGFGIVSSAFISATEKTILTYSPSGYLQYWDVEQGVLKKRVATLPNLEKTVYTPSGRYMAASNGRELLYIDLISGMAVDKKTLANIEFISMTPDGGEVVCYGKSSNGYILSRFNSNGNTIVPISTYANLSVRDATALAVRSGSIYLASPDGSLNRFDIRRESMELLSQSRMLAISDMAVNSRNLLLSARKNLISLDTRFFDLAGKSITTYPQIRTYPLPFQGGSGVSWFKDDTFLIWTIDAPTGTLSLFSPDRGILKTYSDYPYSFSDVSFLDNHIVTLDRNGECRILDLNTDQTLFQFSSFGLRTLCFTPGGNLLAGRNRSSGVTTPLLHINTVTGETVPITDENMLVSRLTYDASTGSVYSLGIEERRGRLRTVLKRHSGEGFTQAETLLTSLGENPNAAVYIESESTKIYTSLGSQGVKMLYWGGFSPFEDGSGIPGKLLVLDSYLLSLNSDNSISFWKKTTGELAFTFYIFQDLNWIALFPQNRYMASEGALKYIEIFEGNSIRTVNSSEFRITN